MDREYSDTKGPMTKAILMIAALVLIVVLIQVAPKAISKMFNTVGSKKTKVYTFNEEDQASIRKELAGDWQSTEVDSLGNKTIERIEAQAKGYFYWFQQKHIPLMDGTTHIYSILREDFILPYSTDEGSEAYNCDVVHKSRIFLFDDTCRMDLPGEREGYELGFLTAYRPADDTLIVNDRVYTPFTDTTKSFFPINLTGAIEDRYMITCNAKENIVDQNRFAIAESALRIPFSQENQQKLLTHYYIPLTLKELDLNLPLGKGEPYTLKIDINASGTVKKVHVSGKPADSPAVKNAIRNEAKKWKFIPTTKETKVSYTGIYK